MAAKITMLLDPPLSFSTLAFRLSLTGYDAVKGTRGRLTAASTYLASLSLTLSHRFTSSCIVVSSWPDTIAMIGSRVFSL